MKASYTAAERNFNTFYVGDNPWELANGLLRNVANRLGVQVTDEWDPTAADTLREALESRDLEWGSELVRMLWASGLHKPFERSFREGRTNRILRTALRVIVGTEAWQQDRVNDLLMARLADNEHTAVVVATGAQQLGSNRDLRNTHVRDLTARLDRYPTASEYAEAFVVPSLQSRYITDHHVVDAAQCSDVIQALAEQEPRLGSCNLAVVEASAIAGLQTAVELRTALRTQYPRFDCTDREPPQLYMITDGLMGSTDNPFQTGAQIFVGMTMMAKTLTEAALADR